MNSFDLACILVPRNAITIGNTISGLLHNLCLMYPYLLSFNLIPQDINDPNSFHYIYYIIYIYIYVYILHTILYTIYFKYTIEL